MPSRPREKGAPRGSPSCLAYFRHATDAAVGAVRAELFAYELAARLDLLRIRRDALLTKVPAARGHQRRDKGRLGPHEVTAEAGWGCVHGRVVLEELSHVA